MPAPHCKVWFKTPIWLDAGQGSRQMHQIMKQDCIKLRTGNHCRSINSMGEKLFRILVNGVGGAAAATVGKTWDCGLLAIDQTVAEVCSLQQRSPTWWVFATGWRRHESIRFFALQKPPWSMRPLTNNAMDVAQRLTHDELR